jgi:diguanylate cyclase (GGDEF)-like protein
MTNQDLLHFLEHCGKDPSHLIFEDELTGIYNRRFLYQYLHSKVSWDALEDHPLSLIMLDVDNFKQINDSYGHETGDQALIWVAGMLKEVAGKDGFAIRYAGDEFMILFSQQDKRASMKKGAVLHRKVHKDPFHPSMQQGPLNITLSIGIASAPEDAKSGKSLIQKADTALYSAKKRGRDCFVNASEVEPEEVFDKTAIYHLEEVKIVGRGHQLSQVAEALKRFNDRKSQFLIAQGPAGIGKSEFLETVRQNLAKKNMWLVKVNASPQEMFRPYYLLTKVLIDILKQREDKGTRALKSLSPKERAYLAQIIPQLGADGEASENENDTGLREGIFTTLVHFIPRILDKRPLLLFIDDLHFADEATMLLLHRIIVRGDIPVFVFSTSTESAKDKAEKEKGPLERFYGSHHQELDIQKILLTPLSAPHIAKHIQRIFPNVLMPENFEKDLAQITQGNPLFISEIVRKLILDQKIALVGNQWVIRPLKEGYLPRSLEQIVSEKIAALDADGRQMLEQLAAIGDHVSLSTLTGSSEAMEAKVSTFIDQAAAQGLLQSDFELNDEVIRFLGKRILEICYSAIDQDRRRELHQRIGKYQETLYESQLLPSAATLAYHFKRSTDQDKATNYEQILAESNNCRFNAQEAVRYTADVPLTSTAGGVPLDPEDLARVPKLIRDFMVAVRNIRLYPPSSKSVIAVTHNLKSTIDGILENNHCIDIMQIERAMVINGQKIGVRGFKVVARSFLELLNQLQLKGIAFYRDISTREVEVMLEAFGRTEQKTFRDSHWERLMAQNELEHIELKQIRYTRTGDTGEFDLEQLKETGHEESTSLATGKLSHQELALLAEILRNLLGVARTVNLYPLESRAAKSALEKLARYLRSFIERRGVLTLSRADDALLANGEKVIASDFKVFADKFHKYLARLGLSSLTFLRRFSDQELETFAGALGDLPDGGVEGKFWSRLAKEQGLSGILFDQHLYEVRVAESPVPMGTAEILIQGAIPRYQAQPFNETIEIQVEPFQALMDSFPNQMKKMLLSGAKEDIRGKAEKLFSRFNEQDLTMRKTAIRICRDLLEHLTPAFQHDLAKLLPDPLLTAFSNEKNPDVTAEMAAFLNSMVDILIEFVDYQRAAQILSYLQKRRGELEERKDSHAQLLAKSLEKKLEPSIQKLLSEDLKSGETARLRNAAQLLASLGQVAVPFLTEIIKQEDDYRARKIAALLLKKQGQSGAERLRNLLVLEVGPEERSRILDVIDTLTPDLNSELGHALGDENPQVREAAFRLAERLNNKQTIDLLMNLAKSKNGDLAVSAIKCLGKLKPPNADEELIALLDSAQKDEIRTVCCRALGQIASHAAIEPLSKMLLPKGFFLFKKKRSAPLRAAAAFALGQISHPSVSDALAPFVEDEDPRVRDIARAAMRPRQTSHH